jgi:tetratricopeptide (TPR) repeat protein
MELNQHITLKIILKKNYPEAIKSWEKAKSLGNKDCEPKLATAYFQVGNKFQKENKHNFAINSYSKALEYAPADVNILYNRGISFYMTGEKEKSCSDWNKALELGSSEAEAVIEEYCN